MPILFQTNEMCWNHANSNGKKKEKEEFYNINNIIINKLHNMRIKPLAVDGIFSLYIIYIYRTNQTRDIISYPEPYLYAMGLGGCLSKYLVCRCSPRPCLLLCGNQW